MAQASTFRDTPPTDAPPGHLLALPRTISVIPAPGAIDVSTTSAHDFDVDASSGFMPPLPPLRQLPEMFEPWEELLGAAVSLRLRPSDAKDLTDADAATSALWRDAAQRTPVLPTESLHNSETALRRAHHVLAFLLSFYAHTSPQPDLSAPPAPLRITKAIAVPLVAVSTQLRITPVVTYADTVLWNWTPSPSASPAARMGLTATPSINLLAPETEEADVGQDDLEFLTLFSSTHSEAHFYRISALIELRGARALNLMESTLDELFLSDEIALRRIEQHLHSLASVINEMSDLLKSVSMLRKRRARHAHGHQIVDGCDPHEFYHDIRPWYRGGQEWPGGEGWEFEGVPLGSEEAERARWSVGASAGQSTIIHALDIFLNTPNTLSPYLHRMQAHMPRHHRAFLGHLRSLPPDGTLGALVQARPGDRAVRAAFNAAVTALRGFRDQHMAVAARYIVAMARRDGAARPAVFSSESVKGTGGTDLVPFLKGLRDGTVRAAVPLD